MDVAALQGKTITEYAIEKLSPPVPDEEQAWADLKTLVELRIGKLRRCRFQQNLRRDR